MGSEARHPDPKEDASLGLIVMRSLISKDPDYEQEVKPGALTLQRMPSFGEL